MYETKQNIIKKGKLDNYYTPPEAFDILYKYIPKNIKTIWEPACGTGRLVTAMTEKGYHVLMTDIAFGVDFLDKNVLDNVVDYHMIVTNPPFSKKTQFLKRCYELGVPFALLLPTTALEGKERQELYKNYGIEVILPNKRYNFSTDHSNKAGSWFHTSWFTYGLNIGKQLIFEEI